MIGLPWVYFSADSDLEPEARETVSLIFAEQCFAVRWRAAEATKEAIAGEMEYAFAWVHVRTPRTAAEEGDYHDSADAREWEMAAAKALELPCFLLMRNKVITGPEPAGAGAADDAEWTSRYDYEPDSPDDLSAALRLVAAALAEERTQLLAPGAVRLPPPVVHFTGRAAEVAWLSAELAKARPGDRFSLIGPGGMGKTAIARAALERVAEEYPGGIYLHDFYAAPTRRAFEDSILGEEHGDCQEELREDIVHHLLGAEKTLVYLEGMEKLRENARGDLLNNIFMACGRAVVLLTSRNGFDGWQNVSLEIGALPLSEAADLLRAHAGRPVDPVEPFASMAELLGRQPLALTLAGSMLLRAGAPAEGYVRELVQEGLSSLPEGQRTQEVVRWLFRRQAMALPVPAREAWLALALHGMCLTRVEMLAGCLGMEEAEIPPLLKMLEDYGLATREMLPRQMGYQVEHGWRPAHALMSDWARSNLGECGVDEEGMTERWLAYWDQVWAEEYRWSYMGGDGSWHAFLCTHLRTWLAHLESRAVPEKRLQTYRRCGRFYQLMGRLVEGLPCARTEVALATRIHGPEHGETLDSICELAWFTAEEDRGKAIGMAQEVLASGEEREGPESGVACNARRVLAAIMLRRNHGRDEAMAVALLEENLTLTRHKSGLHADRCRLASLTQLGWHLYDQNHPAGPAHFREVLDLYPQDDHPDCRLSPDFIHAGAALLDHAGFSGEALLGYQRAEAIFQKIPFCAERLWMVRGSLAELLAQMGRWEEAGAVAQLRWEASLSFSLGTLYQQEARGLVTAIRNRQLPGETTSTPASSS